MREVKLHIKLYVQIILFPALFSCIHQILPSEVTVNRAVNMVQPRATPAKQRSGESRQFDLMACDMNLRKKITYDLTISAQL